MHFVVRDENDEQYGPVDQETLVKWAVSGRVRAGFKVRNVLFEQWKEATEIDFLVEPIREREAKDGPKVGLIDRTGELFSHLTKPRKKNIPKSSSFEYKYLPEEASAKQRMLASLFDWTLLAIIFMVIFFISAGIIYSKALLSMPELPASAKERVEVADKTESSLDSASDLGLSEEAGEKGIAEELPPQKDNPKADSVPTPANDALMGYRQGSLWTDTRTGITYSCLKGETGNAVWCDIEYVNLVFYLGFAVFFAIVLLYYGLLLGFTAQTFGMWYWGLFIAHSDEELSEVLPFRAFIYTIFMLIFGVLSPFVVFVNPLKRALHDYLCGVRIINIAGRPKS